MKLKDFDKAEAWSEAPRLPLGWSDVKIESVEEGKSSNNNPQLTIEYGNSQGSIREWLVVVEATYGKLKALTDAAGIVVEGEDFDPQTLVGKSIGIYIEEEPSRKDPTQTFRNVSAHRPAGQGSDIPGDTEGLPAANGQGADDDIPF